MTVCAPALARLAINSYTQLFTTSNTKDLASPLSPCCLCATPLAPTLASQTSHETDRLRTRPPCEPSDAVTSHEPGKPQCRQEQGWLPFILISIATLSMQAQFVRLVTSVARSLARATQGKAPERPSGEPGRATHTRAERQAGQQLMDGTRV